jgi:hypothetical protein
MRLELGAPDWVTITIGGVTHQYLTSFTGYHFPYPACPTCQNDINVTLVDLDDFDGSRPAQGATALR